MPRLTIDDMQIEAPQGMTLLRAALANGIYIPHFCYHPLLTVAGNCRMCLVEVEGRSKLEISCNLPVQEGMVVHTQSSAVKKARESVLEFLLINHPIDCPICDRAGECYLQDFYFDHSCNPSRFHEPKVKKPKAVDISAKIKLDDERCVLCTRCVRFCHEISKSQKLTVAKRGDDSFITTAPLDSFDDPYSLNTVDICPVGALTSKDFRFKKRVWFLKSTPSICPSCANGCPMWIDHDEGVMYRWRPNTGEMSAGRSLRPGEYCKDYHLGTAKKENGWMCDEGRLSYKKWQGGGRLSRPLSRTDSGFIEISDAVERIRSAVAQAQPNEVSGILSAQCSCEDADVFTKYLWEKVGTSRVYRTARHEVDTKEDSFLIKKNKNPNLRYLNELTGLKDMPETLEGSILLVTDTLDGEDLLRIVNFKWKMIIQITHDRDMIMPMTDIVLPRTTFAETDGTFVNFNGMRQKFCKAVEPKGSAKSVAGWIATLC